METLLLVLTLISASTAISLAVVVARLHRTERRRSDARVEALIALAGAGESEQREENLVLHDPADQDPVDPPPVPGLGDMFAQPEAPSPWGRRLLVAGACALIVTVAGFALTSIRGQVPRTSGQATALRTATEMPIELLSLAHTAGPDSLTITGTVQNPRDSAARTGLVATALVFAPDGTLAGTGRAPLDFTRLGPGDESLFVVKVATTASAARYRVGFQDSRGAVVAHVDRRGAGPLARHE